MGQKMPETDFQANNILKWLRKCNCQTALQLANSTQLQLVGEGVDFVFPRKKEEGRKKKEEEVTPT